MTMTITFNGPDSNFFDTAFLPDVDIISDTSTEIVIQNAENGFLMTLTGTGFTVDDGNPQSGTITGMNFDQDGTTVATFSGIAWDAVDFLNAAVDLIVNDSDAGFTALFSQQDINLDASSSNGFIFDNSGTTISSNITVTGSDGNDVLEGGSGNDVINPGNNAGSDRIIGSAGNDSIVLSNLNDGLGGGYVSIDYGKMDEAITYNVNGTAGTMNVDKGSNGTDTITDVRAPLLAGGTTGGLGVRGTQFNDVFNIESGGADGYTYQDVRGMGGNDTFNITMNFGQVRIDYLNTGATTGIIMNGLTVTQDGLGGTDTYTVLGTGNFEIRATEFADTLVGSSFDDRFILYQGDDSADGGAGFDTLRYDRSGVDGIDLDMEAGTVTGVWRGEAFTHTVTGFEQVRGSREQGDNMRGDEFDNVFLGRNGNDTLRGNDGDDVLYGENDDDKLYGGNGRDELYGGAGTDTYEGGQGNDIVIDESGASIINLGAGNDYGAGADGDDFITGGKGGDELHGQDGEDDLSGNAGADTLDGGFSNDILRGAGGDDTLLGNDGEDRLLGGGNRDVLYGGSGDDTLEGSSAADTLYGGEDFDLVQGGNGDDTLDGGAGDDIIKGGKGNDLLYGGEGNDTMTGGAFRDDFIFVDGFGNDVITDFNANSANEDIVLVSVSGIVNFTDLMLNHIQQVGADVVITDSFDTITLEGVLLSKLDETDFIF